MNHLVVIEDQLLQAERHVQEGAARIERQRVIARGLEQDGHLTAADKAQKLLKVFEETQRLHIVDRNRLADELCKSDEL